MIDYSFPLYRPPAEANNIIIQATYGCSHNNCTFCSMYKSKKYQVRKIEDIFKEIDTLANMYPDANKVFLADGDALSLATDYLVEVLQYLKQSFVNFTPMFPAVSLLCFHSFHKHVSTYFTQCFHLETMCETKMRFSLTV